MLSCTDIDFMLCVLRTMGMIIRIFQVLESSFVFTEGWLHDIDTLSLHPNPEVSALASNILYIVQRQSNEFGIIEEDM